jgi:hypothetical protein
MKRRAQWFLGLAAASVVLPLQGADEGGRRWLAGDHHVHSRFSVEYDQEQSPPSFTVGGDAHYPIPMNATMARRHGLDWMVSTDHGGPGHSKINLELAYPELLQSRAAVPEVIQFFAMEFDTPGADHSSLIVPYSPQEADDLYTIESRFNSREAWPRDPNWNTEPRMLEALRAMQELPKPPLVIAHHPSRSAPGLGEYGATTPAELRAWNDVAPDIAVGMEGAPGHQAASLSEDLFEPGAATPREPRARAGYDNYPTLGGYDQMTARLGGFWDSMLGEGRRWWITANSDSHVHWNEGGSDFWPGEYAKTYVLAEKNHDSIMDGIRHGHVFVTTGDLISELWVNVSAGGNEAGIGEVLQLNDGQDDVKVELMFIDPQTDNFNGDNPAVARVDLIVGAIKGPANEPALDTNPSTQVEQRFTASDWRKEGAYTVVEYTLQDVEAPFYLRVRGTNTDQQEPQPDALGENPWQDLWFYSNPVFVERP